MKLSKIIYSVCVLGSVLSASAYSDDFFLREDAGYGGMSQTPRYSAPASQYGAPIQYDAPVQQTYSAPVLAQPQPKGWTLTDTIGHSDNWP